MYATVSTPFICRAVAAGMKVSMSVNFPVQMPHPNIDASLRQQLASPDVDLAADNVSSWVLSVRRSWLKLKMQRSTSDTLIRLHSIGPGTNLSNAASTNEGVLEFPESRARSSPSSRCSLPEWKDGKHETHPRLRHTH
jgi:hypothetical protein